MTSKRGMAALAILFAIGLWMWHYQEGRPSSMDETRHMRLALDYRALLFEGKPLENTWSRIYPPLYHLSLIPALSLPRPSESKAACVHLLYLALFLWACVQIGRSLSLPEESAFLAASLTLGAVYVQWAGRRALIDFPLMCWAAVTLALLLKTDGFSNRAASLRWGTAAGLGMLLKAPFLFFASGPTLWQIWGIRRNVQRTHVFIAIAAACVLGGSWYFWQWPYFIDKAVRLAQENTGAGTDPSTWAGCLYYLRILESQLGLANLVLIASGIGLSCFVAPALGRRAVFWSWALPALVMLTLLKNKDPRHSLPLIPALAWLAAVGWTSALRWPIARRGMVGVCLGVAVYQGVVYDRPGREDWKIHALGERMQRLKDPASPFLSASILSHHPRFFSRTFVWTLNAEGIPLNAVRTGNADVSFAEFLVTREGDQGTEGDLLKKKWAALLPESRGFQRLFVLREQFSLPDGSVARLYQRQSAPWQGTALTPRQIESRLAEVLRRWVDGPLTVNVRTKAEGLRTGRFEEIRIVGGPVKIQKIPIRRLSVVLHKPWIQLDWLFREGRLGLLALESIEPQVDVEAADAVVGLARIKGIQSPEVAIENGRITAQVRYRWLKADARIRPYITAGEAGAVLEQVRLLGIPLPGWILGKAHRQQLRLSPIPDFPARLLIQHVFAQNGHLIID